MYYAYNLIYWLVSEFCFWVQTYFLQVFTFTNSLTLSVQYVTISTFDEFICLSFILSSTLILYGHNVFRDQNAFSVLLCCVADDSLLL